MADLISIVIPVYNSQQSLLELYFKLRKTAVEHKLNFEYIFVDDNSSDNSYKQILQLYQKAKNIKGIQLAENYGQQNAIFCGFSYAAGDYIVTMDDDLQHRPEDIPDLYRKIKEGYDIVYAVPQGREYNFYRYLGSKITNFLFDFITYKNKKKRISSFRIITKKVVKRIIKSEKSFIYISALVFEKKVKTANIFSLHQQRKYGKSNYNFLKLLKLFFKLYIYYGRLPILKYFRSKNQQYKIKTSTLKLKNEKLNY